MRESPGRMLLDLQRDRKSAGAAEAEPRAGVVLRLQTDRRSAEAEGEGGQRFREPDRLAVQVAREPRARVALRFQRDRRSAEAEAGEELEARGDPFVRSFRRDRRSARVAEAAEPRGGRVALRFQTDRRSARVAAAAEQRFREPDRSVVREPQAKEPVRGPVAEAGEPRGGRLVQSRWSYPSTSFDLDFPPRARCILPEPVWLGQRPEWPGDKEARVSGWVLGARPEPRLSNP